MGAEGRHLRRHHAAHGVPHEDRSLQAEGVEQIEVVEGHILDIVHIVYPLGASVAGLLGRVYGEPGGQGPEEPGLVQLSKSKLAMQEDQRRSLPGS